MEIAATDHRVTVAELPSGAFIVSASGVLEGDGARSLKDVLFPLAAASDARVVVDIAGASGVDRSVLGVVVGAAALFEGRGGDLVVVSQDPRVCSRLAQASSPVRVERALADAWRVGA